MEKMPDLFVKPIDSNAPRLNPDSEWVLSEPSIAYRLYDGITVSKLIGKWRVKRGAFWCNVLKEEISEAQRKLPLNHVPGESPWSTGKYELVWHNLQWRLIAHQNIEQISNLSMLCEDRPTVEQLYAATKAIIDDNNLYGVFFKSDNKYAQVTREEL